MATQHPFDTFLTKKQASDEFAKAQKQALIAKHGSISEFQAQLKPHIITRSDDPHLAAYHRLYNRLFQADGVIPIQRFQKALDRSHSEIAQGKDGNPPFRYELAVILDPETGEALAGTSYVLIGSPDKYLDDYYHGTLSGNFTFVAPEVRAAGLSHVLQDLRLKRAHEFFSSLWTVVTGKIRVLVFNEHNDPLAMTPGKYLADNCEAVIDQFERMQYWQDRGYRRLPFGFVEPPGTGREQPVYDLCLNVCNEHERNVPGQPSPPDLVSAETILYHLRGFYTACALGKKNHEKDRIYKKQRRALEARGMLRPQDDRPAIAMFRENAIDALRSMEPEEIAEDPRTMGDVIGARWPLRLKPALPQLSPQTPSMAKPSRPPVGAQPGAQPGNPPEARP